VRRRCLVRVSHRVVCGTLDAINHVLAPSGCQINTAFVEQLNLDIRQHVAAVGRRVTTLCKHEAGLRQQLALYQTYHNFYLYLPVYVSLCHCLSPPTGRARPDSGGLAPQRWRLG
jgi:hypothetical protein